LREEARNRERNWHNDFDTTRAVVFKRHKLIYNLKATRSGAGDGRRVTRILQEY